MSKASLVLNHNSNPRERFNVRYLLLLLLLPLSISGCAKAVEPANPIATQRAPIGILPASAHPLSYEVGMKVDPRQASFSGAVTIEVWIDEPSDGIWLHGDDPVSYTHLTLPTNREV